MSYRKYFEIDLLMNKYIKREAFTITIIGLFDMALPRGIKREERKEVQISHLMKKELRWHTV